MLNCFNFFEFYYTENQLVAKKYKSCRKFLSRVETKKIKVSYNKA